ncbi:hypothetical protein O181_007611 [Austropuccinia psidii MF-1]|uniref:Acetyl-CoA synthetase-like protein n=1 Tax=Austropuccinia psidii MF-1 TaxID=1389203 RepID=A0A9Q3BL48_9BASI|nr:hypothetical protein [Austropuccinia psidii MF-1]
MYFKKIYSKLGNKSAVVFAEPLGWRQCEPFTVVTNHTAFKGNSRRDDGLQGTSRTLDGSLGRSTHHAVFDPLTGIFTSPHFSTLHIPTDLRIDQFLFSYSPQEASQSHLSSSLPDQHASTILAGHFRPAPEGQVWLIDPDSGKKYRFEDCKRKTEALAEALRYHLDLQPDHVLVIYAPNHIDYPLIIWACFRAGGIVSCANPSYTQSELTYQLETLSKHFKIAGLVCHPQNLEVAKRALISINLALTKLILISDLCVSENLTSPSNQVITLDKMTERYQNQPPTLPPSQKLRPGEGKKKIAFLSFSSGTTGPPKAVCIPHYSVIANIIQAGHIIQGPKQSETNLSQTTLAVLPFYHIFGLVVVLHLGVYQNFANVVISKFVFENFLDCLIRYKPSVLHLVPPMVVLLTKHSAANLKKREINQAVERIFSGAAPLTNELVSAFRKKYPNIRLGQGYGMTETATMVIHAPPSQQVSPGASAGVLCPMVNLKIMSQGKPVGYGQLGEIWIKSPSNALSYLGNPIATSETFLPDGYVRTGDEGYIDQQGWIYVVERIKELIKVKGFQVAPAELEGHLLGHPSIADVCVIGMPDEYAGEIPRAFVVRSDEGYKQDPAQLAQEIKELVSKHMIRYKWLDGGVEFVASIPKNSSGKLLRRQLREEIKNKQIKAKARL